MRTLLISHALAALLLLQPALSFFHRGPPRRGATRAALRQPWALRSTSEGSAGADGAGASGGETVRAYGASLDADLAGEGAARLPEMIDELDATNDDGVSTIYFAEGVGAMRKGNYDAAVALFRRAVDFAGGIESSRGAQMQLWLAQAMHAAGMEEQAKESLAEVGKRGTGEARKAARGLLTILTAPQLKSDPAAVRFEVQELDFPAPPRRKGRKKWRSKDFDMIPRWKAPAEDRFYRRRPETDERAETLAIVMPTLLFAAASAVYLAIINA